MKKEATYSSETSINYQWTKQRHIQENRKLQAQKSQSLRMLGFSTTFCYKYELITRKAEMLLREMTDPECLILFLTYRLNHANYRAPIFSYVCERDINIQNI
jgi:hypothetical protein